MGQVVILLALLASVVLAVLGMEEAKHLLDVYVKHGAIPR